MRFLEFKAHFESFPLFSIQDIRKWDHRFDTRRLVEWQQKGYILKIINRWYVFAKDIGQEDLLIISNKIYAPSYVSLQWALSFYRLIPEGVYAITAVASLKTQQFSTPLGSFFYKHIKPALLFGYRLIDFNGVAYRLAEPEKLILDYLYLNPTQRTEEDMKALRLNTHELETLIDKAKMKEYLRLFNNKSLEKRVNVIYKMLHHA
jgi:predicted transcriptional regulator of viral defense system